MTQIEQHQRREGFALLVAFAACIPAANWMIHNIGTVCVPNGPCLIPVGPGLTAPSGVLLVGLALILRDLVQRRLGIGWSFAAIGVGGLLSAFFASPALVIASVAAFLLSEIADLLVFTPLQKRGLVVAAAASSMVGLVVDSIVFLTLAFGSLQFVSGQIVGKALMVALALPVIAWFRDRDRRLGISPA